MCNAALPRPARAGLATVFVVAALLTGLGLYSWQRRPTRTDAPASALDLLPVLPGPAPAGLGEVPERVGVPDRPLESCQGAFRSVAVSGDGRRLATGHRDGSVSLWDASTLRPLGEGRAHNEPVLTLAFAPDGRTLASGGQDGAVCVWRLPEEDTEDGRLTVVFQVHEDRPIVSLAFSPDGRFLAGSRHFKDLLLWRVNSDGLMLDCERVADNGPVRSLAFSPDGRTLAVGGQGVRLWAVGETLAGGSDRFLDSKSWLVQALAFSAGGDRIRVLDANGHVLLRDSNGGLLRERQIQGRIARGAFAPDGRHLVAITFDGVLTVYRFAPDAGR
jgi:WD40 repeat protein